VGSNGSRLAWLNASDGGSQGFGICGKCQKKNQVAFHDFAYFKAKQKNP